MRQVLVLTLALAALVALTGDGPHAQDGGGAAGGINVEACAADPKHLGLSRIVEIDTAGGVDIGGEKPGSTHFLNDGEVVLTFDDGPIKAYTRAVLKALADHCTKATFFMVGRMAIADPDMVREVAAGGHTIGSHTWSHKNLRPTVIVRARQEIESAISTISKVDGAPIAPFFRFPYLSASRQAESYLKSRNIGTVWIDIDSKDYRTRDPRLVEQRIISQLVTLKKGIVLMHDIQPSTAKMLPTLLNDLRDRGFKVVHMVAKAPVQTLPSFDDAAERAISAKTAARQANSMAPRSMVWTMAPEPLPVAGDGAHQTTTQGKEKASPQAKKANAKSAIAGGVTRSEPEPTSAATGSADKRSNSDKGKE